MGISMPIHIPELPDIELPDIPHISNFSKISIPYVSAPPTYQHLQHTTIMQK